MVEMNFQIGYGSDGVDFFILRDVRRTPSLWCRRGRVSADLASIYIEEVWNLQEWYSLFFRGRLCYSLVKYRSVPVSYTHLDVYKRQALNAFIITSFILVNVKSAVSPFLLITWNIFLPPLWFSFSLHSFSGFDREKPSCGLSVKALL